VLPTATSTTTTTATCTTLTPGSCLWSRLRGWHLLSFFLNFFSRSKHINLNLFL
jgi:hypothetical protein